MKHIALLLVLLCLADSTMLAGIGVSAPADPSPQSNRPSASSARAASSLGTPGSGASTASNKTAALDDPLGDALSMFRKGDFDGAMRKYKQLIAEKPKSPDAYAGLIRVFLKKRT